MENNYLSHHGILGQKWGVRRFQNEDGSLTAKGRKRYIGGADDSVRIGESKKWKPKDVDKLSDEELNRRNNRLAREQQYVNATTPQWKKDVTNVAKEAAKKIVITSLVTLLAAESKDAMKEKFDKLGPFLDKESQHYIPRVIKSKVVGVGAAFLMNLALRKDAKKNGSGTG